MKKVLFIAADQWRGDAGKLYHEIQPDAASRCAGGGGRSLHPSLHACRALRAGPGHIADGTLPLRASLRAQRSPARRAVRQRRTLRAGRGIRSRAVWLYRFVGRPRTVAADDPRTRSFEGVLPGFRVEAAHNELSLQPWATHLARKGYPVPPALHDLYRHPGSRRKMDRFSRGAALYGPKIPTPPG